MCPRSVGGARPRRQRIGWSSSRAPACAGRRSGARPWPPWRSWRRSSAPSPRSAPGRPIRAGTASSPPRCSCSVTRPSPGCSSRSARAPRYRRSSCSCPMLFLAAPAAVPLFVAARLRAQRAPRHLRGDCTRAASACTSSAPLRHRPRRRARARGPSGGDALAAHARRRRRRPRRPVRDRRRHLGGARATRPAARPARSRSPGGSTWR